MASRTIVAFGSMKIKAFAQKTVFALLEKYEKTHKKKW